MFEGRKVGTKCEKCGVKYSLDLDSVEDQSLCPKCIEEAKDTMHRLRNSAWADFEAKWFEE
jgi:PHP family Zn ribbon phosphoesterase